MPEPIVFYDIPRKATKPSENAWSPNTWKTRYGLQSLPLSIAGQLTSSPYRYSLNIKGLPYRTVWVEYPDIDTLYKKFGLTATEVGPTGVPFCALPVIYDPNTKTIINDSASIARYLDKTYPDTPALIPQETDALHAAFQRAFEAVLMPGNGDFPSLMMPETQARLNPASQEYFRQTRENWFNAKLEDLAPPGSEKRRKHWEGLKGAFHEVAGWLQRDGREKLFFLGEDRICFADITIASFVVWLRITFGEASEEWQDVVTWDGGRWAKFAEAFGKYEYVDEGSFVQL